MEIKLKNFSVRTGQKIKLSDWPTFVKPFYESKKEYQNFLQEKIDEMADLQRILYASNNYAMLLIFQGMDCSGKDGVIRHVLSGINPQGCEVFSFKQPSAEELEHDFLWRTACRLPERGKIGIFNRSYYEEVLIVRVHPEILLNQNLPVELREEKKIWDNRYLSIVNFEDHLHRNGTRILKFYLHLSQEEQRKRILARIDKPEKNWKLSISDIKEKKYWSQYTEAYEDCFTATSTDRAPWYIVPADDKENARLIISQTIVEALKNLKLEYPKTTEAHEQELKALRKDLMNEK